MSPLLKLSPAERQHFFVAQVPHNQFLGMQVVSCAEGLLVVDLPYSAHIANAPLNGAIHEGAITTLIDAVSGSAVLTTRDDLRRTATLDLRVDLLRSPGPGLGVCCEARCIEVNDEVGMVRATVLDGDQASPVAVASATFAVFRRIPGLVPGGGA